MKYLIDFDHTLLDTEALKARAVLDGTSSLVGTPGFWRHHNVMDFLFPDVLPWLESKPKESLHILTAFKPSQGPQACAFQEGKIRSGGFCDLVASVTVMEGHKGLAATIISEQFSINEPLAFIDDRFDQCHSVKTALPHAHCFMMVRYNVCPPEAGDGIIPISCLAEVDAIMDTL
jgi:hypothetical protein